MDTVLSVDLELKKAFQELKAKTVETKHKMKLAEHQIKELNKQKTRAELTKSEVLALHPNTVLYQSLGLMFLRTDMKSVQNLLESRSEVADEKIKSLDSLREYLASSLKDSEDNFREMLQERIDRGDIKLGPGVDI